MPRTWSIQAADQFWSSRKLSSVLKDHFDSHTMEDGETEISERNNRDEQQRLQFTTDYANFLSTNTMDVTEKTISVSNDLNFWAVYRSWTLCKDCGSVDRIKLMPSFQSKAPVRCKTDCHCKQTRYIVPCIENIPECLKGLSYSHIIALRPLDLHVGDYKRLKHGYRQKTNMCRVTWSNFSPQEKISEIAEEPVRTKLNAVYNFLMSYKDSAYSTFVKKRDGCIRTETKLNMYISENSEGIECALWPHLYPKRSWCETTIHGNTSRLSVKVAFFIKVFSSIVDYGMDFELLQFHYDLWLFKTVSGAISTARKLHCSPARALNAKTFSPGYWKMQHRLLQDAVDQFGYPSLFLTISPYEWTFPMANWIENIRNASRNDPTHLAAYETIHIAHTLEQLLRGYLCGSNTKTWTKHVFTYQQIKGRSNVNTYFYRFEFQQRGTLHVHLVVWLKNVKKIQHDLIRADIPWQNPDLAFLIYKLQRSNEGILQCNEDATKFAKANGNDVLELYHPQEAFALNLRCYLSSVVPALRCRMDVQFTDGNDMLLRYVSSYVSKWQDAYSTEKLFSKSTSPYQAAYRHIKEINVCEPEMWLYMSSIKISWTSSRTKEYIPPKTEEMCETSVHSKYLKRSKPTEHLSFLQWLRSYQHTRAVPKPYKGGNTLVSVRYASPFHDEFFLQDLIMNCPHRALSTLFIPNYKEYPQQFRYFACAIVKRASEWADLNAVKVHFERLGHRDYYVNNLLSHISSLHNMVNLWHRAVLNKTNFIENVNTVTTHELDKYQTAIFHQIVQAMKNRNEHYSSIDQFPDISDDEDTDLFPQTNDAPDEVTEPEQCVPLTALDWKKFFLITGEAGTGKSQIISRAIEWSLDNDLKVLIATPTALLAIRYDNWFGDAITAETIHSTFSYPVHSDTNPTINWSLSSYDFIFVDEVSMITCPILQHVVDTITQISIRPVVVMCGDCQQQQPIETVEGVTMSAPSALLDKSFYHLVHHYKLHVQYRVVDQHYNSFLQHIRYWQPTQHLLDSIQNGRILCDHDNPTDEEIMDAVKMHPDVTALTISRKAAMKVNAIVTKSLFCEATPLACVQCDDNQGKIPIYAGMRVMITQNRDKRHGIVNGQEATIFLMENQTVFLKLRNGALVPLYPLTYIHPQTGKKTCYPFVPSYALTMTKSQGQNLTKVLLWFDSPKCAPGCAYMALSRVSKLEHLHLLTRIKRSQIIPVTRENMGRS